MLGLIDVDGHNFPNLALMKISAYHKSKGEQIEWAMPLMGYYDTIYASKVFTFTPDFNPLEFNANEIIRGGTGYDIAEQLPKEIESVRTPDYSIYPQHQFSIQFYSRGCIRKCPFCLVNEKEGKIHAVEPMDLNQNGKWIEVLDNNFFASPEWKYSIDHLQKQKQPVKFHGVDVRIMTEEQAYYLNKTRLKGGIHIAWDLPQIDLTQKLKEVTKYIKPSKLVCYVLVGFNSTKEQDYFRLRTLKDLGILPFVQAYRDFENKRKPTQYEKDISRWANRMWLFNTMDFKDYEPRKGFKCAEYFK